MAGKKLTRKQAKKLMIKLGWEILEHKFRYYEGARFGLKPIPDEKYDKIESNYRKLAKLLGEEPKSADRVGFPRDTLSGRLVAEKLTKGKFFSDLT